MSADSATKEDLLVSLALLRGLGQPRLEAALKNHQLLEWAGSELASEARVVQNLGVVKELLEVCPHVPQS